MTVDVKKPRTSLLDVARHAGVSSATVSRVLNDTAPVRPSVRERVLASVNALGYRAHASSALSTSLQNSIALIIPDILNPYFTEVARIIQHEVSADGFLPLVLDTAESLEREQEFLKMLAGQPVRAVVACGSRIPLSDLIAIRSHLTIPMVIFNRDIHLPNVSCVLFDLENATYRAARHLIELHHTRISFLPGPSTSETSQRRQRGVETALAEAGLVLRPEWCPSSFPDVDGGFQAMSALLALPPENRPTGIITYNDLMALGVLHAIRVHRLRVPEDISVIGIDNISMAEHANPPLTTIAVPRDRIGRIAMQILRRMIQGQPLPEESYTLIECSLTIRESTGLAPNSNGVVPASRFPRSYPGEFQA
jgi:LacI family transcriptional regulator